MVALKEWNKATASALGGALVTIAVTLWPMTPEMQGAIQTLVVTALVLFVPNIMRQPTPEPKK